MALPQSMDPELRRQSEAAADRSNTSVDEWIERAARRELDREARAESKELDRIIRPASGAKLPPLSNPPRLRGGKSMAEAIIEEREERDRMLAGEPIDPTPSRQEQG